LTVKEIFRRCAEAITRLFRRRPPPSRLPSPALPLEQAIKVYGLFRDYVKHEDGLVNNRLLWLLSIHGFLYATYGFTIQKKLEIAQKIADIIHEKSDIYAQCYIETSPLLVSIIQTELFLLCIIMVGALISIAGLISIGAAKSAAKSIREIFNQQYSSLITARFGIRYTFTAGNNVTNYAVFPSIVGGGRRGLDWRGFVASTAIPWVLLISWSVAFIFTMIYLDSNRKYLKYFWYNQREKECTSLNYFPDTQRRFAPTYTLPDFLF
jgi:hypothetical protein